MRRLLLLGLLAAAGAPQEARPTDVCVLGVVHSVRFVDPVVAAVRAYKPDVVLVEIPAGLFEEALARIDKKGFATRKADLEGLAWIPSFPELYRGVIPLRKEMGYTVVPVSGWTPAASADRRRFWAGPGKEARFLERRKIHDAVTRALDEIQARVGGNTPAFLNSDHYADLRQLERTVWSECFDEGLGSGGEARINRAHYANIARALDAHRSKRVLIVYGAAHRYWYLRELRKRRDVRLLDAREYLQR